MIKIFIADDEFYVREHLKNSIDWTLYGFEIVGDANNGIDAYEMIKKTLPDIAIIDISMPRCNGLELIEKLNMDNQSTKYIILSGYNEFEFAQKAIKLNVKDYILKPVDTELLLTSLQKLSAEFVPSLNDSSNHCNVTKRIKNYILEHYSDSELSIQKISQDLFLNYSYVCSCFKRDMCMTITDYINQVRIQNAEKLFKKGVTHIGYVAEQIGYKDPGYFCKRFKKLVGLNPSEYIKTL